MSREPIDKARACNNSNACLYSRGEHQAARRHYEKALAILSKIFGREHPDTEQTLNNLGILLEEMVITLPPANAMKLHQRRNAPWLHPQ